MAKNNVFANLKSMSDMSYLLDPSVSASSEGSNNASEGNVNETIANIEDLIPFENHPFRVDTEDENFLQLVDSIKENGLIEPILVRPKGDKKEIIAGHRRTLASKIAGLKQVPVVNRVLDNYEATIIMVHSNFYRDKILISEKAKAYRMCMEAEKHQGKKGVDTAALIGKDQDSKRQVYRYIRLSYLSDALLEFLDNGKIPMIIGGELSYLDQESQDNLLHFIEEYSIYPTLEQAKILRKKQEETKKSVSYEEIVAELTTSLKKKMSNNVSFKKKDLQEFFDDDTNAEYMSNVILVLLSKYRDGEFDGIVDESEFQGKGI